MNKIQRNVVLSKGSGERPPESLDGCYLLEISLQCRFAIAAFGEIEQLANSGSTKLSLLAFAHMLLVFASNASKIVFPSPNAAATAVSRSVRLRTAMGLSGGPPIELVNARNYVEHFDERMERYLQAASGKVALIHRVICTKITDEVQVDDGPQFPAKYLQALETSTLVLTLYDERINLRDIAAQMKIMHDSAETALETLISDSKIRYDPTDQPTLTDT